MKKTIRPAHDAPRAPEFTQAHRTGELTATPAGLTDFTAPAEIIRDGEKVPCIIGYTDYNRGALEPTHIFTRAGITAGGTHYSAETISLESSYLRFCIPCEPVPAT